MTPQEALDKIRKGRAATGNVDVRLTPQEMLELRRAEQQQRGKGDFMPMSAPAADRATAVNAANVAAGEPGFLDYADAFATGVADAGSFAYGDELSALVAGKMAAMAGGDEQAAYDAQLRKVRQLYADASRDFPKTFMGGQIAGGVAQGAALAPLMPAAGASTMVGKTLLGAGEGALMGGIYGSGTGTDPSSRAQNAAWGAGVGGVTGAAVPWLVAGVKAGASKIADAFNRWNLARHGGPSPKAARVIGEFMTDDNTLGPRGQVNMAAAGDDAMIVDAGDNAQGLLDLATQKFGPGRNVARDAITSRVNNAARKFRGLLDRHMGISEGATAAKTSIREGGRAARAVTYDQAYASPINYADPRARSLETLLRGGKIPQRVINKANELMDADDARRILKGLAPYQEHILAKVGDDGSVVFTELPSVRQLDHLTRGMREIAAVEKAGAMGGMSETASTLSGLATDIRAIAKQLVPVYGEALETAADDISRIKAIDLGYKALRSGMGDMSRDAFAQELKGATGPEKRAILQGMRAYLDDLMATVKKVASDPNLDARQAKKAITDLTPDFAREKVAMVIGDQAAQEMFEGMDEAFQAFTLQALVDRNSMTAGRQFFNQAVKDITEPGPITKLQRGQPVAAGQELLQSITGTTQRELAKQDKAFLNELAQALTARGVDAQRIFDATRTLARSDQIAENWINRIASAFRPGAVVYPGVAPTMSPYTQGK